LFKRRRRQLLPASFLFFFQKEPTKKNNNTLFLFVVLPHTEKLAQRTQKNRCRKRLKPIPLMSVTTKYISTKEALNPKRQLTGVLKMPIEAVIFDLDGTLASFNLDYKTLRVEVRNFLTSRGVPASVLSTNESIFEMLDKAEIFFRNSSKSEAPFVEIRNDALAIAEKFEIEAAATTSLMPGAMDALKALKQMNLRLGLCTINSQSATNKILQRFQIADYFDIVIPRDIVKKVKPHAEHFELALKALKVHPEKAVVVGDSAVDMQCAKEIKAVAVGIPTGVVKIEQLSHSGANYIITAISDLPELLQKINKGFEAKPKL
jgi:HAD superfamily hydrolase (TIGR01509 family)